MSHGPKVMVAVLDDLDDDCTAFRPSALMALLLHEVREGEKRHLDALLRRRDLSDLPRKVHLVKGEARLVIPKLARSQKIGLLVMGTVCRTGVAGLIMGNTAEDVLRHVNCSVLTVKPDGFTTPVTSA